MIAAEARSRAHLLVGDAIVQGQHWADEPVEVLHQIKLIAADHRRRACLAVGDGVLARRRERAVKP